ncbi:type III-B CRISPR-associated protein Cas10/Cmr2 [Paenibacillus sp. NPDC058071]|uniref:type III-B CRISPR-associated protein Cas10/Cmr2 n=1 Tax=Paenibacillus sp. NPDC058071 TaxID=3346326 RepID=UPI0036DB7421
MARCDRDTAFTQTNEQTSSSIGSKQQSVLLLTLGPVQEFIAQARRTRDLWFGSHLLSKLSYEAAKKLHEHGANLIFPHFREEQKKVANKIVALVDRGAERDLAIMARTAARNCWYEYAKLAKKELVSCINEGAWERQIKDFLEFYAVWVDVEGEQGYSEALKQAELLMAARKTMRDFKANEPGKLYGESKSDLDAGRESVLWQDKHPVYGRFGIKRNEELDAISLVKRLAHYVERDSERFLSVCDIAFLPLQRKIAAEEQRRSAALEYQQRVAKLIKLESGKDIELSTQKYHSWMFYSNRLEDNLLEIVGDLDEGPFKRLMTRIEAELAYFYAKTGLQPTPYYAFVLCDGDHMHKRLQEITTPENHQKLSEKLSEFADQAEDVVRQQNGILIYSGGDDVMALLPLDTCLAAIDQLQKTFKALLNDGKEGAEVTLSVGMAVAHMFEPLEQVRSQAASVEKLAKEKRDSLAIWFQKRSGGSQMKISVPFQLAPHKQILLFQEKFRSKSLSHKYAYELRELYLQYNHMFRHGRWIEGAELLELLVKEIIRLAVKKRPETMDKQQAEENILPVTNMLNHIAQQNEPLESLKIIAELAIIAAELFREGGGLIGEND